ncbi:circularly permuted type 2 ATP-grasp protein [Haliea sp. E17]|uniref:circularly permuted type 2 ATP-grasp protein n=1 Tax=Haliea sp. E17 TaxID=3401576 RepID=UPI003AAFD449
MGSQQQNQASSPATSPQAFQEAYSGAGEIRPHWQYLLNSLEALGPEEFTLRRQSIERILRDNGATYNDYSPGLVARPWGLDPIPLVLTSEEWNRIESGVRERAELLDLILRDIYGPRNLLKHGVIPPELIFGSNAFLRECQGLALPGEQQLILYATDLVRTPDGELRVMSDRTQTPSGTGYSLVNRQAMSRVFPSLFRDSHVHRLSLYFNQLRQKLNQLNPNGEVARVAVLTPGAYNETYFEHVFLANYLGYPLVQGRDLTVRDGYVWLKTLDGLSRIDVILRRVDDLFCDPVELFSESQLGVPGLLECVRMGNVAVANPLGSGILENRGLARFLPAVAKHFLGRELSLSGARTWWCGDPSDLAYALDNLDSLVIKTTSRGLDSHIVHGGGLSSSDRDTLISRVRARPAAYVAQERLDPSTSPVWSNGEQHELPFVLRSFAVAGESSYVVMPGGLTRVGMPQGAFEISNRLGSISKDTWILASEPEKRPEPELAEFGEASTGWAGMELPSRVVDNLFWVGRYTERAEASLRLLRTVFTILKSEQNADPDSQALLLRAVTHLTGTYPGFLGKNAKPDAPLPELHSVVLDARRPGSVAHSLQALLQAVDQVKDYMSADTQRILNDLRDAMAALPRQLQHDFSSAPEEALDHLVTILLALSGLSQESMVRGLGWHFLDMGRRLERSQLTLSLIRSLLVPRVDPAAESLLLEAVLISAEALMTYRRRYQRNVNVDDALDLLLLEPANPRSLLFQLSQLEHHLGTLPDSASGERLSTEQQLCLDARSKLVLANLPALAATAENEYLRGDLDQMLARLQQLLARIGTIITDRYFEHALALQSMTPGEGSGQSGGNP